MDPEKIEEVRSLRKKVRNANDTQQEGLSALERFAVNLNKRVGSFGFFIIVFCWSVLWIGWNIVGPDELRFDPFPAFVLWLFISNLLQLVLMPLLLVGQNLLGKQAEARADQDFEVNKIAEKEIEVILEHLKEITALLKKRSK